VGSYEVIHVSLNSYYGRLRWARAMLMSMLEDETLFGHRHRGKVTRCLHVITEMVEAVEDARGAINGYPSPWWYLETTPQARVGEDASDER